MSYFKNYSNYKIQLLDPYITWGIIGAALSILIWATCRKRNNKFFDIQASQTLRGIAILCLICGHLSRKCLSDKMFFDSGGYWAVIIFLFISGYGLYQKYQFSIAGKNFWIKRITKLYVPLWISLILFILLDYYLINLSHPAPELIFNFLGGHFSGVLIRVNSVAWFVEYIMTLYLVYWLISKLSLSEHMKIALLLVVCLFIYVMIRVTPIKNFNSIWLQYTLVFPAGVTLSKYKELVLKKWGIGERSSAVLFLFFLIFVTFFYKYEKIIATDIFSIFRPVPLLFAVTLFLVLVTRINSQSYFLLFIGNFSYEIYLLHLPFMVKYDFILFREPLALFFFVYLLLLVIISMGLAKLSSSIVNIRQPNRGS